MNKVILSGRTTKEPELKYLPGNGTALCTFTLAVRRSRKNAQGEYESDFINCQAWAKSGELIAEYVGKGQMFTISGRLQVRTYEDKDSKKCWVNEVVVEDFDFPQKQQDHNNATNISKEGSLGHEVNLDDDIHF